MTTPGRSSPVWLRAAAIGGAVWGLGGYALLWGHTPFVVHRSLVESILGTLLLLPVRVVLWTIHGLERAAGSPFDFSGSNWWIGLSAAAAGAVIVIAATRIVRWGALRRRSGREGVTEPAKGV